MISRINLLGLTRPELIQVLGLVVTIVLLISSFFANRAEVSMEYGDRKQFIRSITITLSLGILFLVGVLGCGMAPGTFWSRDQPGWCGFLRHDRFPCLPCVHRGDLPGNRLAQWLAWSLFC